MIASLFPLIGGVVLAALGAFAAIFSHLNATSKVAAANQKLAEAQTVAAQAQTQAAQVADAAAQANATAAQSGAQASKERQSVESDIAALPAGDAVQQLRNDWQRD